MKCEVRLVLLAVKVGHSMNSGSEDGAGRTVPTVPGITVLIWRQLAHHLAGRAGG